MPLSVLAAAYGLARRAEGDPAAGPVLDPEIEELWSSRALLIVLLLLILSFWVSYYLKVRRIRSIHETIVALFAGMFVGMVIRLSPGNVVQNMISFKSTILLNVLLPPIILNSGYQLKQENFFRNFAVILTFAFAGTFISAVALGVIVYVYALLGLEGLSLTIIECLLFGSTLSATDPVTILAIFNTLHVDPKLYSVIFGESILNDAVAIVMFETLSQFHDSSLHILSIFHGTGIFLLTFCLSMALGVVFGLACSLMLKHSELGRYTEIESCLVFLVAYTSYFFSNALTMSGIVSLLFCGITLKHYAYHNMSHRTQRTSRYMFGILAQLSENFIFIYLGLSLFTSSRLVYKPMFILVTAVAVCLARYCAVFPISKLINVVFRARGARHDELPHSYQMMLFWAGLRGAVGVALAAGIKGESANALRTTVLVTVVLTMVIFGGTIGRMIEILGIRTGVEEDEDESSDEEGEGGYRLAGRANEEDAEFHRTHARGASSGGKGFGNGRAGSGSRFGGFGGGEGSGNAPEGGAHSDSPYRDRPSPRLGASRLGASYTSTTGQGGRRTPSDVSFDSSDSEGELPAVNHEAGESTRVWRDGQWFTVLDERYLLPVFSNATASRRQASRKALKSSKRASIAPGGDDGEGSGPSSPYGGGKEFTGSFGDILSSLVSSSSVIGGSTAAHGATSSSSTAPSVTSTSTLNPSNATGKRRQSGESIEPPLMGAGLGGIAPSRRSYHQPDSPSRSLSHSAPASAAGLTVSIPLNTPLSGASTPNSGSATSPGIAGRRLTADFVNAAVTSVPVIARPQSRGSEGDKWRVD